MQIKAIIDRYGNSLGHIANGLLLAALAAGWITEETAAYLAGILVAIGIGTGAAKVGGTASVRRYMPAMLLLLAVGASPANAAMLKHDYPTRPTHGLTYLYATEGQTAATDPPRQDFECADYGLATSYLFNDVAVTVYAVGGNALIEQPSDPALGEKALTCDLTCPSDECYTVVKFKAAQVRFYGRDFEATCFLQGNYSSPHVLTPQRYGFDYWLYGTVTRLYPIDILCWVEGEFEVALQ